MNTEDSQSGPLERLVGRLRTRPTGDPHLHALVHEAADAIELLQAENERQRDSLRAIGDTAHDKSTGPAVPDALWEIRAMAYEHV